MNVKLLTEHHLMFLSLKGGYTGSSESTLVKMPHSWKSHVTAQYIIRLFPYKKSTLNALLFSDIVLVVLLLADFASYGFIFVSYSFLLKLCKFIVPSYIHPEPKI